MRNCAGAAKCEKSPSWGGRLMPYAGIINKNLAFNAQAIVSKRISPEASGF
jgi:hypothetical protein